MIKILSDQLREQLKDRYTKRGVLYSILGLLGISYELLFRQPAEALVIIFYSAIIAIGLILILYLKEQN